MLLLTKGKQEGDVSIGVPIGLTLVETAWTFYKFS